MIINFLIVFLFTVSSQVYFANTFGLNYWKYKTFVSKHEAGLAAQNFSENHIEQPLDHFDSYIQVTYKQRYFVNSEHWDESSGPVFLFIGGEGTVDSTRVTSGFILKAAQRFKALVFAVEHRFYGQSLNEDGLKMEKLHFLTSQQALADLAHFHQVMIGLYNLTSANKWVSFGGSYPGSLSAWFRLKYPHLVVGAVSSSSPVHALVNFQDYNNVVAKSLSTELVGGSLKCANSVKKAFTKIDSMIKRKEFEKLSSDFQSCETIKSDIWNLYQFASNTADIFMGIVQYNNQGISELNVENVCDIMLSSEDSYSNFIQLNEKFLKILEQNCSDNSWKSYLNQLMNTTLDEPINNKNMRQWTYQTCNQFGYYQTCDQNTECLFSNYLSLAPNLEICRHAFNISQKKVYDQVDFTNSYYGSNKLQGSNILFVNGLIDPWHALSVLTNLTSNENAIVIPGASHCADMRDDKPTDTNFLKDARKIIMNHLSTWLQVPPYEY